MNKKFDWDKWHRKALEDSKLENQIFNSIPQSSFEELYDYIVMLENLIKIDYEDNCHLADMCRERDARIAELESEIKEFRPYRDGYDPYEDFPKLERGFECSILVLGRFEYEEEEQPITNWDLCRYWFNDEKWVAINGYLSGDDLVVWYPLPKEREE